MGDGGMAVRLVGSACTALWGYTPGVIPAMVASMGSGPALRWFAANFPRFLVTQRVLGPVRTHLAGLTISLTNGCVYCAYGRAHALELIYLRDRGRLFPLDARTLDGWIGLSRREIRQRLRSVLEEAGLHAEVIWVDRTLALLDGGAPIDSDERRIAHLCRMVGTMNEIAVAAGTTPDGAHDPVNKDAELKARLADAQTA
ncbi:hypothetical protein H7X46_28590 [Pseudonocardia sp. C8]|uniref:hypothetical protein n=1 Tax=Pseudonocardia sp. C8 TaxID=2762759 RepID=UPI001642F4E4|nr:hypothetical protein [Pseudonocardia sp. C8]MBC3195018.1 hypothetical protein [Pseudonocardia sp. C8]